MCVCGGGNSEGVFEGVTLNFGLGSARKHEISR